MRTLAGLSPSPIERCERIRAPVHLLNESVEMPARIIAQIMGHKPSSIAEKHYRHRLMDLLCVWHEKIEGWILKEAGITAPQESTLSVALAKPRVEVREEADQRSGE